MTGSISRQCSTENRKGNVSFSPDMQNATSVGGHRLQTEISEPHLPPPPLEVGRKRGREDNEGGRKTVNTGWIMEGILEIIKT